MCYFIVDTYIDATKGKQSYTDYIEEVKPIVESYGGEYLVRSEKIVSLHHERNPHRVVIIRFPHRQQLNKCFASKEYKAIKSKREDSVDARAIIVEDNENTSI